MKNLLDMLYLTRQKFPDREAVEDEERIYTWQELVTLSENIGTAIAIRGRTQRPVPVFMEKSADTLAAFWGVVQAGCFYVSVDPGLPAYRIQKMFQTLMQDLVICKRKDIGRLRQMGYEGEIVVFEMAAAGYANQLLLKMIQSMQKPQDLLYAVFTSGSTGTPKAVVVSHQGVMDFIGDFTGIFSFDEKDVIASQAPFDFDVSVKDIYTSAWTGAKLVLIPKKLFSVPAELVEFLSEKKVTSLIWAVSALCLITAYDALTCHVPENINKVLFSGEVMPPTHLKKWQEAFPAAQFANLYGPSEVVCNCTYYIAEREEEYNSGLPLGYAFPKREVFLLNEEEKVVVEPGEKGEICVAGNTLADGYYHNQTETRSHFIRKTPTGDTYYKTGDLGFYGKDGLLYFAGRKDFQIKRMGHRIELEEIETAAERSCKLRRCCCMYRKEKQKLVLFYEGDTGEKEVKQKLREMLPAYMLPDKYIRLDHLKLNKNGKIDRRKLEEKMEAVYE